MADPIHFFAPEDHEHKARLLFMIEELLSEVNSPQPLCTDDTPIREVEAELKKLEAQQLEWAIKKQRAEEALEETKDLVADFIITLAPHLRGLLLPPPKETAALVNEWLDFAYVNQDSKKVGAKAVALVLQGLFGKRNV